jgi:AcrR family transcriptional regulator
VIGEDFGGAGLRVHLELAHVHAVREGEVGRVVERALFAEHGYAAVALKDIVKAAKVNGASVNYHFGDKRNLYREVIERSQGVVVSGKGWRQALACIPATPPTRDKSGTAFPSAGAALSIIRTARAPCSHSSGGRTIISLSLATALKELLNLFNCLAAGQRGFPQARREILVQTQCDLVLGDCSHPVA